MIELDSDLSVSRDTRRQRDIFNATREIQKTFPSWSKPDGYTWHHQFVDGRGSGQMILVRSDIHKAARHWGAFAAWQCILDAKSTGMPTKSLHLLRRSLRPLVFVGGIGYYFTFTETCNGWTRDGLRGAASEFIRDRVMADDVEAIGGYVIDKYLDPIDEKLNEFHKSYLLDGFGGAGRTLADSVPELKGLTNNEDRVKLREKLPSLYGYPYDPSDN